MTIPNQLVVGCLGGSKPVEIMTILIKKVIVFLYEMVISRQHWFRSLFLPDHDQFELVIPL